MSKTGTLFTLIFSLFFSGQITAQQPDFDTLDLKVVLQPKDGLVNGEVTHSFKASQPVDSFFLNAISMDIDQLELNGKSVNFKNLDTAIWVYPDEALNGNHKLFVKYQAQPRKGIYFIGWDDPTGRAPKQIWTQGQGIDHRHWIPHNDEQTDKVLIDLEIAAPTELDLMANGILEEKQALNDSLMTWHYSMEKPMSSYLIAIAAGDYNLRETTSENDVDLQQYYYPEREADYPHYYYKNEEIFNFLKDRIGVPFPWQNYKQAPVQDFRHGAMENTTATIFGDFFLVDEIAFNDKNYTYVNAHELAHQWFGNLVTASGSDEHWLHEGFATYYQWLSERNLYGDDFFEWERYKAAQLVFEASDRDTVPLGNGKAGSARFYQKGAWVLDMLNAQLGDSLFDQSIKHYLNQYAFGVVTTDSLTKSLKSVTGFDFTDFFDKWVRTAGEPRFLVRPERSDDYLKLESEWIGGPKPDSVLVSVFLKNGHHRNFMLEPNGQIEFKPAESSVDYWVVNPGMQQLMQVVEQKESATWRQQYQQSEHLLDRYFAVEGFAKAKGDTEFLAEVAADSSEYYPIRSLAFSSLADRNYPHFISLMEQALGENDIQLKKELVKHIDGRKAELGHWLPALRKAASYQLRENALHLSVNFQKKKTNQFLYDSLYLREPGIPGHKVLISALLYQQLIFKDKEALQKLVDYTSLSFDFLTRINAMQALDLLQYFGDDYAANLLYALTNSNWQLRKQARETLKKHYQVSYGKKIILKEIKRMKEQFSDFDKRVINRTFGLNLN